jgi:radical SAM protein with 4Fe4S-binding SPASM domain
MKYSRKMSLCIRMKLYKFLIFVFKIKSLVLYGNPLYFNYVTFELSSDCNRKCVYCPNGSYQRKKSTLDKKVIKKVLSDLKRIDYKGKFVFSGYCEPLLDKRLKKIILLIRKFYKKNRILLFTNGDYLSKKMYDFFKKNDVYLLITLHSPISKNIGFLDSIKNDKYVIMRKKIDEMRLSNRTGLVNVKYSDKKDCCINPLSELIINCYGYINLCPDDYFSKINMGNVLDKNVLDIWLDKHNVKLRNDISKGRNLPELCKKCLNINAT